MSNLNVKKLNAALTKVLEGFAEKQGVVIEHSPLKLAGDGESYYCKVNVAAPVAKDDDDEPVSEEETSASDNKGKGGKKDAKASGNARSGKRTRPADSEEEEEEESDKKGKKASGKTDAKKPAPKAATSDSEDARAKKRAKWASDYKEKADEYGVKDRYQTDSLGRTFRHDELGKFTLLGLRPRSPKPVAVLMDGETHSVTISVDDFNESKRLKAA